MSGDCSFFFIAFCESYNTKKESVTLTPSISIARESTTPSTKGHFETLQAWLFSLQFIKGAFEWLMFFLIKKHPGVGGFYILSFIFFIGRMARNKIPKRCLSHAALCLCYANGGNPYCGLTNKVEFVESKQDSGKQKVGTH